MPTLYKLKINVEALDDIRQASAWYEEQQASLGKRFAAQVKSQINNLKKNPLTIAVRYKDVRCLKIKKFPFLVHFTVEDYTINIFAVIHTSRNPKIWDKRNK